MSHWQSRALRLRFFDRLTRLRPSSGQRGTGRRAFAWVDSIARWHALCSKKRVMTKLARFLFFWVGISILSFAASAEAQTITMPNTAFDIARENDRPEEERPNDISRQDCLDARNTGWNAATEGRDTSELDDHTWIVMEPRIDGLDNSRASADSLQVWVSETEDCTKDSARINNPQCWLVYSESQVARNNTLIINPRDVVASNKGTTSYNPEADRPESICSAPANLVQRSLTFYILYFTAADNVGASLTWTQTGQDLAAPPPPDNVSVGAGDEYLFFEWDIDSESEDLDTLGFVFYCVPSGTVAAEEEPVDSGTGGDGSGGDPGTGGDGSGGDGSGGDGSGGAASGGETAQGGMGAAGPELACEQNVILDGEFARAEAEDFECGKVLGRSARRGQSNEGEVDNNVTYAVGVAAIDNVGNSGQLTVFDECLMPQEVTTFFEGYDEAGGKGGGGFCELGRGRASALWWLLILAFGASLLRRKKAA